MAHQTAIPLAQSTVNSWQVQLRLSNEPHVITAILNFASRDEAHLWGRAASEYMNGFVEVTAWRVVGSSEPPTHTLHEGTVIPLASTVRQ